MDTATEVNGNQFVNTNVASLQENDVRVIAYAILELADSLQREEQPCVATISESIMALAAELVDMCLETENDNRHIWEGAPAAQQ
jgi:hypothetical protein